jgi:predicted esterase YcpF (UPF0227 family)
MEILYIHGFNSGPDINRINEFKKRLPNVTVHYPQLDYNPEIAIKQLKSYIHKNDTIYVIGTSLGGFYSLYLNNIFYEYDNIHIISINPALFPSIFFEENLNKTFKNYKTQYEFTVTHDYINNIKLLEDNLHLELPQKVSTIDFFVGENDDVINPLEVKKYLLKLNVPFSLSYVKMGHRITNIDFLVNRVKELEQLYI